MTSLAIIPATPYEYTDPTYWQRHDEAANDGHYAVDDGTPPHGVDPLTAWWTLRVDRYLASQRAKG